MIFKACVIIRNVLQAELLLLSENSAHINVEYRLKGLITFADSLVEGQEYRRAVVSMPENIKKRKLYYYLPSHPHFCKTFPILL